MCFLSSVYTQCGLNMESFIYRPVRVIRVLRTDSLSYNNASPQPETWRAKKNVSAASL